MPNEFAHIANYFAPLTGGLEAAADLKDDAALLPNSPYVVTTDTMIEGVHFFGDELAGNIAKKLLRCNLSDIAAKGAKPRYYLLNISLTEKQDESWLAAFSRGLAEEQKYYNITLLGGDTTYKKTCQLTLSITMFGETQNGHIPRRHMARAGDLLCVSGTIGDAYLGLLQKQKKIALPEPLAVEVIQAYELPNPQVELGMAVQNLWHASLDISDGLLQDAGHIARESNLSITILAKDIPLSKTAQYAVEQGLVDIADLASGGDDYQLLFTLPEAKLTQALEIAKRLNTQLTVIGKTSAGEGVHLMDDTGKHITPEKLGYQH